MPHRKSRQHDDVEVVSLDLPLDRATVSWLSRMAKGSDSQAAEMVASMLKMIREDDESADATLH